MSSELLVFSWRVPEGGFRWLDARVSLAEGAGPPGVGEGEAVRLLTDDFPGADAYGADGLPRVREYDPLRDWGCRTLFRTFADTPPTEEGILAFANQYGYLSGFTGRHAHRGSLCAAAAEVPGEPGRETGTYGEPLGWWQWHLAWMRQAVELWDAVRSNDRKTLARLVRWGEDGENGLRGPYVFYTALPDVPPNLRTPPGEELVPAMIAGPGWHPEWLAKDQFRKGDVCQPARVYLNRLINARLHKKTSLTLLRDLRSGDNHLRSVPHSLIGCLWSQLAETVTTGREQWECSVCRRWFEARRRDRRDGERHFCSTACRSRSYRGRQSDAAKMFAAGRGVDRIAKELGAKPEAVRGWLARHLHGQGKSAGQIAKELGVGVGKVRGYIAGTKGK